MTVNYIDSAELLEVLGLYNHSDKGNVDYLKIYIEDYLWCKIATANVSPQDAYQVRQIRFWFEHFIKENQNGIGVVQNYITVWKSISEITDDSCFLKLMAANLHLMWD